LGSAGSQLHVPSLWVWEILNVVSVTVKRQRISAEAVREFLAALANLDVRIDAPPAVADFSRLQTLAERHRLTAYDVAYLDPAIRLSLPLASMDDALCAAAVGEGIELLG
jgi:predicted nucleic acid-binding protein